APFADYVFDVGEDGQLSLRDSEGQPFAAALEQSQLDGPDGEIAYTRSVVFRDIVWQMPAAPEPEPASEPAPPPAPAPATQAPDIERIIGDRLRWLFDEAPVGMAMLDLTGAITDCNRALTRLMGCHREALLRQAFADAIAKEDRGDVTGALSKIVMGTARATHMEVRMPGSGAQELSVSLYASPIGDADGEVVGIVLYLVDATEQKNLEVQFAQSQKMQAVGQLAGGVAHDFNNLLTAMIGFCDLLLMRHGPDDPSFADIQQIRQNANRATNLVRQLLAFSRKQTLQPVRLEIGEALSELSNLIRRLIGETVTLSMEQGPGLWAVKGDRSQFEQIVINLCVNARDAMPGGGEIAIRSQNVRVETPVQRGHDLMPPGDYVRIDVADTGTGISKENLERIFDPFFTTKEAGAGTGLGLSTVYGIVHQSGGFVFVDSAPGEGTTFTIFLPRHEEDVDVAAEPEASAAAPSSAPAAAEAGPPPEPDLTGQGTVLLVEDEDAVRMFGSRALKNKGYNVLEAANGEIALDVVNATDETIDIIVSDVIMPGMNGHTLVGLVRQEMPDVKVILMSGYAEDMIDDIGRDPTLHFLGKPFTLKDLAAKVKEVLES
ncbi:MAG: ATP-binding protein, partial [Rhodospirillaceae bacterium]